MIFSFYIKVPWGNILSFLFRTIDLMIVIKMLEFHSIFSYIPSSPISPR